MKFQIVYKAVLNLEAFQKNLNDLGYRPETVPSSRNEEIDTENFKFELLPKVSVLVFPKGKWCRIQVCWNSVQEMEENQSKLMGLFGGEETKVLGATHLILNLSTSLSGDNFLNELEALYSKHMRDVDRMEKARQQVGESSLDRLFFG